MSTEAENLEDLLRQQESLRAVIESISSELELRPLLTRIVRHACELIGADNGTIGLVDTARNVVRTEAAWRMPESELGAEMGPGVGLAGQVLLTQNPVIFTRYGEVPNLTQPNLVENPVLGMPIFWGDRMIGFFGLGSPKSGAFTERDIRTLGLFAKHAAIAIENARLYAGAQNALGEMTLLYRTSRRISTAIDIDEVVGAYLEQVAARGRYACTVALYEMDARNRKTAVLIRGIWTPDGGMSLREFRVPYNYDSLDPPLDAGQTITMSDVFTDPLASPELRALQRESGRPALAMVPLIVRGQRTGLVILSYAQVHDWQETDLRPYQVTAAQLATAIDSRRQAMLLSERAQQFAILEERQRLARELHDSVTQLLFSMTLIAQSIAPVWQRDPEEGEKRIGRLLELSKQAHAEMRSLLFELRPTQAQTGSAVPDGSTLGKVRQSGLIAALRSHLVSLNADDLNIELETGEYTPQSPEREETLFRITQEALNNIIKHAKARKIIIRLSCEPGATRLTVTDNGVGFDPAAKKQKSSITSGGGMGLNILRERAATHGGTVEIRSMAGKGTVVEAILPESEEEHE